MQLEDLQNKIKDLPTLPAVAYQINIESQNDSFTSRSLGDIIKTDPPLSAKILRLANSAYYGFARQVSSLERAITLLGANTIKNLALTASISTFFNKQPDPEIDIEGLWYHSLGCGVAARTLMERKNYQQTDEAFLCGIIHDIGIIIILHAFPDEALKAFTLAQSTGRPLNECEEEIIGFTHQKASSYLAEKWNFPPQFYRALLLHHTPPTINFDPTEPEKLLQLVVFTANQLTKSMSLGSSIDRGNSGVPPHIWKLLGIVPKMMLEMRANIKQGYNQLYQSWSMDD